MRGIGLASPRSAGGRSNGAIGRFVFQQRRIGKRTPRRANANAGGRSTMEQRG